MAPQKPISKKRGSPKETTSRKTISKKSATQKAPSNTISPEAITGFYFELPASELALLPTHYTKFEKRLLSCITAALKTGIHLHERLSGTESEQIDVTSHQGQRVDAYLIKASRNHVNNDKFMCLRLLGTSLKWIKANLSTIRDGTAHETAVRILQLMLWRTFALGDGARLEALKIADYTAEPDTSTIVTTIESWIEKQKLQVPTYGQMMIDKKHIRGMVESQWKLAKHIAEQLECSGGEMVSFLYLHNKICDDEIPFMKQQCLIPWLLAADLSEYDICDPPTAHDISLFAYTSGPKKATDQISTWTKTPAGGAETRRVSLAKIMETLDDPSARMTTLKEVVRKCEELQGRELNIIDLEHSMCKIGRML